LNGVDVANAGTSEAISGLLKITGSVVGQRIDPGPTPARFPRTQRHRRCHAKDRVDGAAAAKCSSMRGPSAARSREWPRPTARPADIGYGPEHHRHYVGDASGGVLTITDGTHSISMTWSGIPPRHFAGASDGNGGTLVTLNADDDKPIFAPARRRKPCVQRASDTTGSLASNPAPAP